MTTTPEAEPAVLVGLRLRVDLADGTAHVAHVINPDRIRFDLTRQREGWPAFSDAPFMSLTFFAWAALKRQGAPVGTWESFSTAECLDVTDISKAEDAVHPSPTDPGLAS